MKKRKKANEGIDRLSEINEDALCADGFDAAFMGVCYQFGRPPVAAYDLDKVLKILMKDGMSREEAMEYWDYNMVGSGMGDNNCVYVEKM